jgi:hypothetical protein
VLDGSKSICSLRIAQPFCDAGIYFFCRSQTEPARAQAILRERPAALERKNYQTIASIHSVQP